MDASAIACPRCGYDQTGVVESWSDECPLVGTCSECGLAFRWVEILRPDRFRIPWFVEHSPRRWRGLVVTGVRAWFPNRFWKAIQLPHAMARGRILLYVLASFALWYAGVCAIAGATNWRMNLDGWAWMPSYALGYTEWSAVAWGGLLAPAWFWECSDGMWLGGMLPLGVTLLVALEFLLLPTSLRRAKVRARHLVRGFAYALAPSVLLSIHALGLVLAAGWYWSNSSLLIDLVQQTMPWTALAWIAWSVWAWRAFTRHYLRLPHALAVSFLFHVMAILALTAGAYVVLGIRHWMAQTLL